MRADPTNLTPDTGASDLAPPATLSRFLAAQGLADTGTELVVSAIGDGHSNLTYLLTGGAAPLVLRRPPRPPYAESAHDVLREARLLSALGGQGVPLPAILATCEDLTWLGVPFVVMEYVPGTVISESLPPGLDSGACTQIADELIGTLAALHAIDPSRAQLGDPARADSYLDRQLRRFSGIWESQHTRELPAMDEILRWLTAHVPVTRRRSVVHGDYRLGNMLYDLTDRPRLAAVLDWEMAALGDPLADLGYLLGSWAEAGDADNPILALSGATRSPGFPGRDEIRAAYERASGLATDEILFYEVLGRWKSAIFLESSYRRFREGRAEDPFFASLGEGIPMIAETTLARIATAD